MLLDLELLALAVLVLALELEEAFTGERIPVLFGEALKADNRPAIVGFFFNGDGLRLKNDFGFDSAELLEVVPEGSFEIT